MWCSDGESGGKKITLQCSNGELFVVDETVALQSPTLKHMIEDHSAGDVIPLPNITKETLSKVIDYCKRRVDAVADEELMAFVADEELKAFDADFVKVDHAMLFDLFLAANYLNIKTLHDLIGQTIGDMIKGKTSEEIRKTFNISEEEEEVRQEK